MLGKLTIRFNGRKIDELIIHQDVLTAGRNANNDLRLEDTTVSSHHARIFRRGDEYYAQDCDSTNGTYVNGQRIEQHRLISGDVVIVGKYAIEFSEVFQEPSFSELDPTMQIGAHELDIILARLNQQQQLASDSVHMLNKKALNWIAQDENGVWWGFENEPVPGLHGWIDGMDGSKVLLKQDQQQNEEWRSTLRRLT